MNILVASILAPGDRTPVWHALQRQFLLRTTETRFTYGLYLNGVDPVRYPRTTLLGHSRTNDGPVIALTRVVDYFRANKDKFTHFLLLDADAWPVCPAWHDVLDRQLKDRPQPVAAPVRHENLEPFPHPCVVFCEARVVDRLAFRVAAFVDGYGRSDRALQLTEPAASAVLPLIRSNRVSPHPVYGGVYGHLFYHHGADSLRPTNNATEARRFDHYIPPARHAQIEARLYQELLRDPVRLMARLTGTAETVTC